MADEQDRWLDRETAETLLRGEPLGTGGSAPFERAERLAATLAALAASAEPARGELPGEEAALAAFRAARAGPADDPAALGHGDASRSFDAGLVRLGARSHGPRPARWARPLRLGLAAALAVGMVGGVAVAAGTGILPTPFGRAEPEPAATVSAAATPDRPLGSPSAGARDGATPGPGAGGTESGDPAGDRDPDGADRPDSAASWRQLTASCQDLRAGKVLDDTRDRALTEAAGGASRVAAYCRSVLATPDVARRGRTGGTDPRGLGPTAPHGQPGNGTADRDGDGDRGKSGGDGKNGGNGTAGTAGGNGKGGQGRKATVKGDRTTAGDEDTGGTGEAVRGDTGDHSQDGDSEGDDEDGGHAAHHPADPHERGDGRTAGRHRHTR